MRILAGLLCLLASTAPAVAGQTGWMGQTVFNSWACRSQFAMELVIAQGSPSQMRDMALATRECIMTPRTTPVWVHGGNPLVAEVSLRDSDRLWYIPSAALGY